MKEPEPPRIFPPLADVLAAIDLGAIGRDAHRELRRTIGRKREQKQQREREERRQREQQ